MKRVLIIDDDVEMANAVKYVIQSLSASCSCTVVTDPYDALLEVADNVFDLVLVDQHIPGLFGSDILKHADEFIDADPILKQSDAYKVPVKVVLMSGSEEIHQLELKFHHFSVTDSVQKKDLTQFLKNYFQEQEATL